MNASPAPTVSTTATDGGRDTRCCQRVLALASSPWVTTTKDARGMPVRYDLVWGRSGYSHDRSSALSFKMSTNAPTLETVQVRLAIRDQTRADVGIEADHSASSFRRSNPSSVEATGSSMSDRA